MRSLFFSFILLVPFQSICQVTITNTSLTVDTNILYHRTQNYLTISGAGQNLTLVSSKKNEVKPIGDNKFKVVPESRGRDTLLVFSGKKLMLKKTFFVDTLSAIRIQLGNISRDTATVTEILANGGLRLLWKGTYYKSMLRIPFFRTSFLDINGNAISSDISTEGPMLSEDQKKIISTLKRHDRIIFTVVVDGPDSRRRELPPYTLVIK